MAVLHALAVETPPPPREPSTRRAAAAGRPVMQLLAKDPADRPPTAQAVAEALQKIERDLASKPRAEKPGDSTATSTAPPENDPTMAASGIRPAPAPQWLLPA